MAVDLLAPLRSAYSARIQSEIELANRREREQARQAAERQNRMANIGALAGAAGGAVLGQGNPAAIAAGASLGNMAGRAVSGGQAPGVAEIAGAGANLYGLYSDSQTASQNTKINQALTQNAINELQGGLPAGMTPESAAGAQSSQRLAQTFAPGITAGQEVNVAAGTSAPAESDERLAGLLGPGMSTQAPPNAAQQKTLDSIRALQEMQAGGLGRIKPGDVAAVAQSFLPKKGDILSGSPGTSFFRQNQDGSLKLVGSVPAKPDAAQTFEVRIGRGPNAQVLGSAVSLEEAQAIRKDNPNAVIYKTSTEPNNTGEGTGMWMRFNAYADQRVAEVNQRRQEAKQPPMSSLESEAFHKRVVDELNRQDFQRETFTIDPTTNLPARKPGLSIAPIEKLVKESANQAAPAPEPPPTAGPLGSRAPITEAKKPIVELKQLTPEQNKGFTGSSTAMELLNVMHENVGSTGFITGPAKELLQRAGFMTPDGTLDFALAKARMDNIAQEIIKGIPSNFDVQTFQKTLAKIGDDPEANKVAIKQGMRQLARAMGEQIEYAKKFNMALPEQSLQTAKEFGVDVDAIMGGKSNRIAFDKPLGIKMDPLIPKTAAEALKIAKENAGKNRWMLWQGQLRPIQ